MEEVVLSKKGGFIFKRKEKNHYYMSFDIKNNMIILHKILDFNLIKLIFDLNGDIYEKVHINKLNENEAILWIVMKHLFVDIGLPQRYFHLHMEKIVQENCIFFFSQSILSERPEHISSEIEIMNINKLICECNIITDHHMHFTCNIVFDESIEIPPFAENVVGFVLNNIFKKVKQFIENMRI